MDETTTHFPLSEETKPVVGMIHVGALPGTPGQRQGLDELVETACTEARLYREAGVNCLMLENMHDVPYLRGGVGPEIVAAMTVLAREVRREVVLPMGIQILAAADQEALAVAHAAGLDFIRTECFCFAHVADEGLMQSNAAKLLRYRRMIGATGVQVWADIKKKHASHSLTADLTIGDVAEAAEFMGAETIIVTGTSTGRPPQPWEVAEARDHCGLPVFVGSGVGVENVGGVVVGVGRGDRRVALQAGWVLGERDRPGAGTGVRGGSRAGERAGSAGRDGDGDGAEDQHAAVPTAAALRAG